LVHFCLTVRRSETRRGEHPDTNPRLSQIHGKP
jgi:hypothetical protein